MFRRDHGNLHKPFRYNVSAAGARELLQFKSYLVAVFIGAKLGAGLIYRHACKGFAVQGHDLVAALKTSIRRRRTLMHIQQFEMHHVLILIDDENYAKAENIGLCVKDHLELLLGNPVGKASVPSFRHPAQFVQHSVQAAVVLQRKVIVLGFLLALIVEIIDIPHEVEYFLPSFRVGANTSPQPGLAQCKRLRRIGSRRSRHGDLKLAVGAAIQIVPHHDFPGVRTRFATLDVGPLRVLRQARGPLHGGVARVAYLQGYASASAFQVRAYCGYVNHRGRLGLTDGHGT